ncbi:MAG: hypothetical protein JWM28_1521 [Chitinophagaceae bacterium]|nr:hypothetical protein [Chitinophagaceae bacterium]
MKKLFSLCILAIVITPIFSFKDSATLIKHDSKVEVIFNRQLDFNDIVKIKLDLSQKGIVINYNQLGFDKEGKLNAIDFFVDFKDGFSGGASASGNKLNNLKSFGFVRDYSENAKCPFGTGYIK